MPVESNAENEVFVESADKSISIIWRGSLLDCKATVFAESEWVHYPPIAKEVNELIFAECLKATCIKAGIELSGVIKLTISPFTIIHSAEAFYLLILSRSFNEPNESWLNKYGIVPNRSVSRLWNSIGEIYFHWLADCMERGGWNVKNRAGFVAFICCVCAQAFKLFCVLWCVARVLAVNSNGFVS